MNLSTHSISSPSTRYATKPAAVVPDAASAEPKTEFDTLFAGFAERREEVGARKNELPRNEARANARRAKSPSSQPRERIQKQELSKQKPNEHPMAQIEAPSSQPTEAIDRGGDEVSAEPDAAMLDEEQDNALDEGAGSEDTAAAPCDTDEAEAFDLAPPAEGELASNADAEEISAAEIADLAGSSATGDVAEGEKAKNVIPSPLKRGAVKPFADAPDKTAADFAEIENDASMGAAAPESEVSKNFLPTSSKEVRNHEEMLGINGAKPATEMNPAASPHELASLLSKQSAMHDEAARVSGELQNLPTASAAAPGGLHQAVNAAMEAGEKLRSSGQRAVDLQFSFGADDLSVRVELHEGRVHATFRTDSAELRGALAQEWQLLNAAGADRARRFSDPVFVAHSSASAAGDHSEKRDGRDQDLRAPAERFAISNSRSVSAPASPAPVASAMSPQTAVPLTALRLHAFA